VNAFDDQFREVDCLSVPQGVLDIDDILDGSHWFGEQTNSFVPVVSFS